MPNDMTRHDLYHHELEAIFHHLNTLAITPAIDEIYRILGKVAQTDAGPLPRGDRITREHVVAAICMLYNHSGDHIEAKDCGKGEVLLSIRPKDRPVEFISIKVSRTNA